MLSLTDLPAINGIRVGRLFYKPAFIHELLAKSVRPIAHEYRYDGQSTIGFGAGSCTLVSHGASSYVVATRHQLMLPSGDLMDDGLFETIRFASSEGGFLKNILVDQCLYDRGNADDHFHDIVFFRVQREWLLKSQDRPYFLPLEPYSQVPRRISFFYGHPVSKNEVEYEPLHAYSRTAFIDGELDTEFVSKSRHLRRYSYRPKDYEMNGFSGGAAFSLVGDIATELRMVLDGITIMASGGVLHLIDADYLLRAVRQFDSVG